MEGIASSFRAYILSGRQNQPWQDRSRGVAERVMVVIFILMRITVLGQCLLVLPDQLHVSHHSVVLLNVFVVWCLASIAAAAIALKHGTMRLWQVGALEVGSSIPTFPLMIWAVGDPHMATPAALALSTYVFNICSVSGAWPSSFYASLITTPCLAIVFAAEAMAVANPSSTWVASTTFGEIMFGLAVTLFAWTWRRLASQADAQTDRADAAERELERQHFLNAAHDVSGLLRYLAAHLDDPLDRATLKRVALSEANRWRSFAHEDGNVSSSPASDEPLATVVEQVAADYPGLRVFTSTELCGEASLSPSESNCLRQALSALLGNVRAHARTDHATIHGRSLDDQHWVVTVADEGIGFDTTNVPQGYGLAIQTTSQLAKIGVTTHVRSALGEGTTVTLTKEAP